MMISPDGYIEELKEADYNTLIEERDQLIEAIVEFENKEKAGDRSGEEWMIMPSPEVQYQVHLECLAELCKLMHEKYNEDYVCGDKQLGDRKMIIKDLKQGDTVLLTDGRAGWISDLASPDRICVEVGFSPLSWDSIYCTIDDVVKVLSNEEYNEIEKRVFKEHPEEHETLLLLLK